MLKLLKLIIFALFVSLPLAGLAPKNESQNKPQSESGPPPHILLFTCQYGAGQKMATQAIVESLPDCKVQVVDMYDGPLQSLDPMRSIDSSLSYDELYNSMAKKEYNRLLNFAGKIGPKAFQMQHKKVEKLLIAELTKERPDMIISCIPLVTPMLATAAKKVNIPLLIVTTDIDISAFCYGLAPPRGKISGLPDKSKFRITVPYAEKDWKDKFGNKFAPAIQNALVYNFGYPTRKSFSEPVSEAMLQEIRGEYEIQNDEQVILVLMDGTTTKAAIAYANLLLGMSEEEISQITGTSRRNKIRFICLCGDITQKDNNALMSSLNVLNQSQASNARVHICAKPETPKIAELASLPELGAVISKPSSSIVNEMIKKKVPMVYHVASIPLDWEHGNMEYGVSRGFGFSFKIANAITESNRAQLARILKYSLEARLAMLSGKKAVPEADIDFAANLRATVVEMLK